jgi:hypothetical protein
MKFCHRGHKEHGGGAKFLFSFFSVISVAIIAYGCSLPNLEKPQCTAARDVVKRFYSFHFAGDMHPSDESLVEGRSFLTDDLFNSLLASDEKEKDYFTATSDYPKAFRVGSCSAESDTKVTLQVLLLWRDDTRSEQKEVHVEAVKIADKWRINQVTN